MLPVAVDSGQDALEQLSRGGSFDLNIVDMHMPGMDGLTLASKIRSELHLYELPLIMLTSLGQHDYDQRLQEFRALLSKPVKPSQLYNCIHEIFAAEPGRQADLAPHEDTIGADFDGSMGAKHPLRILLAEDNSTNQQLALLSLQRLGYRADVAANGLEALELLRQHPYDLILMDVQMPEMDGLEATRVIRRDFPQDIQPGIVAMTANVMQGDREECLAAGMNDYIGKPFEVRELVEALKNTTPTVERGYVPADEGTEHPTSNVQHPTSNVPFPAPSSQSPAPSLLDPAALERLEATLGSQTATILPMLVENFLKEAAMFQEQARQALETDDAETLRRLAHTLKSNAKNFGATALAELCQHLESRAKAGELESIEKLLEQIASEWKNVRGALEEL